MTATTRKRWMVPVLILLVLLLIVGAGFWYWQGRNQLPVVEAAPNFTLQNVDGQKVSFSDYDGKVRLVEFMFASCKDICPTTTANMVQVQKKLKQKGLFGDKVEFVSLTFDPTKDTPAVLKTYADALGIDQSGWALLRGTEADTQKVVDDYGVYVEKQEDGTFVHSTTSLFLVDGTGNVRKIYQMGQQMSTDEVYNDIVSLAD